MQMHRSLLRLLFYQELDFGSIDGMNLSVVEGYTWTLLFARIPTNDGSDVAVQVDLVI